VSRPPARPKLYHITHLDNLASIVAAGGLLSDAAMLARGGPSSAIGMSSIKARRLSLPVKCHAGDRVGDYVPFYLCPRSIMLFVIHCANHPELSYRGGQAPIVHLEADLYQVVAWAEAEGRRWAISLSNAGAVYTEFRTGLASLAELEWAAIAARDFRVSEVKEAKQAEFLVYGWFPWQLVTRIGVHSNQVRSQVESAIAPAVHPPALEVRREWYF
jgi:hypothetical protein